MMRVLHVIPSFSLLHGGPSRAMALTEKALRFHQIDIETITTDDDGFDARNGKPLGIPLKEEAGVRRYFAKRTEFYKISPDLAFWLFRHIGNYDLVHIHALFSFSSVAAAWAARNAGIPYVVRPLGTLNHYGVQNRRPLLKQWSLRWVEGPILRHAAAIHFTSEAEREEAEKLGIPLRSVVIPLAVDEASEPDHAALAARFPALAQPGYLIFLSRLDPKKNIEALLYAAAQLLPIYPDLRLALVGDGEPVYVASLRHLSYKLGLNTNIIWTGFLDGGVKSAALAGAMIFVLPSFSENFGIAAVEALQAGLPCVLGKGVAIAADVTAAGGGHAVEPTANAVAAALADLLGNPAVRIQMAEAARVFAQASYSVPQLGQRLLALYEGILAGSGRPPHLTPSGCNAR